MFLLWLRYGIDVLKALSSGLETTIQAWPKKPVDPAAAAPAAAARPRVVPDPEKNNSNVGAAHPTITV